MTGLREVAPDLFCFVTTTGKDRRFNYVVRRKQGNVLVHGVDPKRAKALDAALAPIGGVRYQLMCHWHEARHPALKWYGERSIEVYAPEPEVAAIARMLGNVTTVKPTVHRKRMWGDFIPCLVSGHTTGFTVYKWRDFLFGGDFINRRDPSGWVSYFESAHVQSGLRGYQRLRELGITRWLPLKSRESLDPPFDFSDLAVDEAEGKMRKKWKLLIGSAPGEARRRPAATRPAP